MYGDGGFAYWWVIALAVVFACLAIARSGRKRIGRHEAHLKVVEAEAALAEAQRELELVGRYTRGEALNEDELLTVCRIAVKAGVATPEQKQLVQAAEVLKTSRRGLERALAQQALISHEVEEAKPERL